jgi:acetyltransferase-like isoleucine patch superfamily enzyme
MYLVRTIISRAASPVGRLNQRTRIWKYRALSTCQDVVGAPIALQPVLLMGRGSIVIGRDVEFGWHTSPAFYSGYCHIEAYLPGSVVEFADNAQINNNAFIKSEGPGIRIGRHALLGSFVEIFDSDFHDLDPARRHGGRPKMAPVELQENVFIGDGARILKGVTIGADSVIGAGSVVTASIPAGVIAAGNPARVIRELRPGEPGRSQLPATRATPRSVAGLDWPAASPASTGTKKYCSPRR